MSGQRPTTVFDPGLQHERTALAWERTAIASMVAGVLMARYASESLHFVFAFVGLGQVVVGAAILLWTARHYEELHGPLRAGDTPIHPTASRIVGLGTIAFTGAAFALAACGDINRFQTASPAASPVRPNRTVAQTPAAELVAMLNRIFSEFDRLCRRWRIEKIKTIGDAYMAAAGVPLPMGDHAERMADMACDMLAVVDRLREETGVMLRVRIGMASGPVMAARAAACATLATFEVLWLCNLVAPLMTSTGPTIQPTRQPVMA